MEQFHYLILLGLCLLVTLPLEFALRARVYRRPLRLLMAMAPMLVIFIAWDLLGIIRGHWTYAPEFITGAHLGALPLEELLFFVVIPICALLSFEGVRTVLAWLGLRDDDRGRSPAADRGSSSAVDDA